MNRLLITPLLAVLALAAGCGGSGGDPDADPASIVPARAPVYLEATLDPDDDVRAVARKLAGTDDPGGELQKLFERAVNEGGGDFSWKDDVEPWIGDRVGIFVTSVTASASSPDAEAALVAPTDDPDKAQEFLERELAERESGEPAPKVADRKHRDVEYKVDTAGDNAVAIVEDFAVTGTERAVRGAIDAAEGDALSDADAYKQARDQVSDEGVAFGYVRLSALVGALGPQGAALRPLLGQAGETIGIALDASDDALRVETASLGVRGGGGAAAGPGEVLAGLPGDAWLAAGVSDIGGQIDRALRQFGQLGAFGGIDLEQILGQIKQQTGIDVREDLISWMGDGGLFVRGGSLSEIGGALVVKSSDPARTERVIPRLGRFLEQVAEARVSPLRRSGVDAGVTLRFEQVPLPIHLAAAGDQFVVAVTDGALDAALDPGRPLSESPAFKQAGEQLGDGIAPAFFLDVAPVRALLDETGALEGADAKRAREVLDRLTGIAAGGKREDDVQRGRLVVGVK
jgi:Protein of unknown function (DUF3352)